MRIISLNVGKPRTVHFVNRDVTTAIFKTPVPGPLLLRRLNLDGDHQADLEVHGGRNKAVYAYPSEHYEFWRTEVPDMDLPWGMFGENLTTEGLTEEGACIGDHFRIGEAVVKVTQPRIPCYKLAIRFGRPDIVKRFLVSRRSGIYFSVVEEGLMNTGDIIERIHEDKNRISVADINRAYAKGNPDIALLRRIVSLQILPRGLHDEFAEELASLER
ncbi:MAG TPA: MOSC domain-containing protein [Candidatus Acidoferrales bacterium]|nr:MOSC domain-containing protein [Candidatus Acidoferrales bacterium]